ncbi:MAG: cytochrome c [Chloroflexi bacterium]|nr:cytochrome c [Chloroflexota bacterium]
MDRFIVPRLGFLLVVGLATLLIWQIVLRSPDTHAHLWETIKPDYAQTTVALVGGERTPMVPEGGVAFALSRVDLGQVKPMDPGRAIYLVAGCATCHGVDARGGSVAPPLAGSSPDIVKHMVREGPGGMPVYSQAHLGDADLEVMAAYLHGLEVARPDSEKIAALQRLTYDPSVPVSVLLKGKAAIRRSCGACHTQPTKEEMLSAFATDSLATGLVAQMVQNANVSLEDGRVIAYYILAILNGADPVEER